MRVGQSATFFAEGWSVQMEISLKHRLAKYPCGAQLRNDLSHFSLERRCYGVDAPSQALAETDADKITFDLESIFRAK